MYNTITEKLIERVIAVEKQRIDQVNSESQICQTENFSKCFLLIGEDDSNMHQPLN
jgi:hypothetical protein